MLAVAGSETPILDIDSLTGATNHNGGGIHFGQDGKLYVSVGDNADGTNSQSLTTLKGKILRINKDGTIPTDNPFYNQATGINRAIWALGLRNPFTFAFQPGTGRLFINDVGESTYEEVDDGLAGRNYGWQDCEGPCRPPNAAYTDPLFYYAHSGNPTPNGCAIVGGAFYNPPVAYFPASYVGKYFFSDLCGGWIYYINPASPATATQFATGISSPVDLQVGPGRQPLLPRARDRKRPADQLPAGPDDHGLHARERGRGGAGSRHGHVPRRNDRCEAERQVRAVHRLQRQRGEDTHAAGVDVREDHPHDGGRKRDQLVLLHDHLRHHQLHARRADPSGRS